jgi:hypothetical protein
MAELSIQVEMMIGGMRRAGHLGCRRLRAPATKFDNSSGRNPFRGYYFARRQAKLT